VEADGNTETISSDDGDIIGKIEHSIGEFFGTLGGRFWVFERNLPGIIFEWWIFILNLTEGTWWLFLAFKRTYMVLVFKG
jgi:hypothetical protein